MRSANSCQGCRRRSTTRPWTVSSCSAAPTGPVARQRPVRNLASWSLRLHGPRMLGFCPDDVTMALACRPDALVFSSLMLSDGGRQAPNRPRVSERSGVLGFEGGLHRGDFPRSPTPGGRYPIGGQPFGDHSHGLALTPLGDDALDHLAWQH